jgi:hypothetical protein
VKRSLVLGLLIACKAKEVPFTPPPPEDAPPALDAAVEIDAAIAVVAPKATKVVVGEHTSCAVMADATLRCWGKNTQGQLGDGTTTDSAKPVMPKLRGVVDVVLGSAHACALLDDRSVTCWGNINFGHKENLLSPAAPSGLAKVKAVFAVGHASCATIENGSLVCWGDIDIKGHIRLPGQTVERRIPTPADGLANVTALTVNGALHSDGSVSFWGADGQPVKTALVGVKEIASSGDEICGLREDGSVACVGPSTRCKAKPAKKPKKPAKGAKPAKPEPDLEVLALPAAKHLAFDVGLCVVTKGGALQCLNARDSCKRDSPWPGLANIDSVSGSCARVRDGVVKCWSVDRKSRLVTAVSGVTGARDLSVSSTHACVLTTDRKIVCWGSNKFGALGRGESSDDLHPEGRAVEF